MGISRKEIEQTSKISIAATDAKDTLYEYLENAPEIPAYPAADDRLIVK